MTYQPPQHKHSVPDFIQSSNFERQHPARISHSSPASLNHDQWLRNHKESIREYGPPRNGPPSLFLFGRDEFERSEIVERSFNESPGTNGTTPQNTPIHPINSLKDHQIQSAPNFPTHNHQKTIDKSYWPYENHNKHPIHYNTLPSPRKNETITKTLQFGDENWSKKQQKADNSSDPNIIGGEDDRKENELWSDKRRTSGSWPSVATRTRFIYAYPEELPAWINHRQLFPLNNSKNNLNKETHPKSPPNEYKSLPGSHNSEKHELPKKIFDSTEPEHRIHRSMIAELKAKFNEMEDHSNEVAGKPMTHKSPRQSPLHIPSDPPPAPQHKPIQPNQQPRNSFGEIHQILQANESYVLPVVERFLRSNFSSDPQKTLDLTEFQESEIPLQNYWERIFRVSDGQKGATIKIENLLTIERDGEGNQYSSHSSPLLSKKMPETFKGMPAHNESQSIRNYRHPLAPNHTSPISSEEAISWQKLKQPSENSYATVLSSNPDSKPTKTSTLRSESDLLALVHRKIARGIPLEWPELFLLKNAHCRWVIGREREYKRLANEAKHERIWRQISSELTQSYLQYQEVLERARVTEDLYTDLAHSIMKAESFWYGARICADNSLRLSWYRNSIHLYKQLLEKARQCLHPNDRSLLTILDKLALIMLESCQADPVTVQICRTAIGAAEQALDMEINLRIERKLIKIKNNLIRIESNILR